MDRRQFLGVLAVAGVTTACAGSGDDDRASSSTSTSVAPATPATASLPPNVFALGVASGDPLSDRVMLWTRLASDPMVEGGGSPDGDVEVAFDVARDADFVDLVVSGIATATADLAHSVHVDVSGLDSDSWYHYRFRAGDQTSPVGRTRTFPAVDASPERFRFVFASCQDFQWGEYGAWGRAAELPDIDAVVFLGDYVYELTLGDLSPDQSGRRVWAGPPPETVVDYRRRYAQTKADLQLQAAHEMAPWIVTFDDHEVSNNYAGDVGQADIDQPASRDRRLAASQAWYEHTPIRLDPAPTDFAELDVHRSFDFGDLARVYAIETRQRADVPACRTDGSLVSDEGPLCEDADDEARSNLGADQEQWLADELAGSRSTWNVLANPIMLAGLNVGTAAQPKFTRDAWDGYPAARRRLLRAIQESGVSNPVTVTGDWHASFVLDVAAEPGGDVVMPELLASSISTVLFTTDYRAENPHVRYFVAEHGYALVTITADELRCEFQYVDDVWDPNAKISHTDTWVVRNGEHVAEPV